MRRRLVKDDDAAASASDASQIARYVSDEPAMMRPFDERRAKMSYDGYATMPRVAESRRVVDVTMMPMPLSEMDTYDDARLPPRRRHECSMSHAAVPTR